MFRRFWQWLRGEAVRPAVGGSAAGWRCFRCDAKGIGEASWMDHIWKAHPNAVVHRGKT